MIKVKNIKLFFLPLAIIGIISIIGCTAPGTPSAPSPMGPEAINLGAAGNYVIMAKTGVSTVPASTIIGDIALSPEPTSALTGFSLTAFTGYATSDQVTGRLYAADMAAPTPANLSAAVLDMEAAYTDAAGRLNPDYTDLETGNIGGLTLTPGLYTWGGAVTIPTNVTISGNANDTWIFQIAGTLDVADSVQIILAGDAQAKNIIWQVASTTALGSSCHFEGIILSQTGISMGANATMNGRLYAQTAVSLIQSTVTQSDL